MTAAIDITTIPYYGETDEMPMVSGTKDGEGRAFKFATLAVIGQNIPLMLAVEPVRESPAWDENPPSQIHRVVRRLVQRAKEHVPIETVLCDREFDSMRVFQTLSNPNVNSLIPKRITSSEQDVLEWMDEDDQEVAVEPASVHVETGSHPMRFLYAPSTSDDETTVFATNLRVEPDEAETFCLRYSRRWQIENEYKAIKGDFLVKTSSKDYRVRLFYFLLLIPAVLVLALIFIRGLTSGWALSALITGIVAVLLPMFFAIQQYMGYDMYPLPDVGWVVTMLGGLILTILGGYIWFLDT